MAGGPLPYKASHIHKTLVLISGSYNVTPVQVNIHEDMNPFWKKCIKSVLST